MNPTSRSHIIISRERTFRLIIVSFSWPPLFFIAFPRVTIYFALRSLAVCFINPCLFYAAGLEMSSKYSTRGTSEPAYLPIILSEDNTESCQIPPLALPNN